MALGLGLREGTLSKRTTLKGFWAWGPCAPEETQNEGLVVRASRPFSRCPNQNSAGFGIWV